MRTIRRHIIHASATPNERDVDVTDIRRWHTAKGWKDVGYHFVIRRNGVLENGRPVAEVGAHVQGHNSDSIGTCLVGAGVSLSDFTPAQLKTLKELHQRLAIQYPGITLHGHREFTQSKTCPGFNILELLAAWQEEPRPSAPAGPTPPPPPRLGFVQRVARLFTNRKA